MKEYNERLVHELEQKNDELAAALERSRASEERWQTIIRADPECVKILSPEGDLLEMNPAGLAMLDASSIAEVRDRPLIEWIAPEYREAFANLHQRSMQGQGGDLEFEIVSRTGTRRWLRSQTAPLRDADGVVTAVLGISRDITAERELELQLRQAQKMDAVGQLAGGIAHDFNNILTVIQGFAMTLLEEKDDEEHKRGATKQIVEAAERAAALTRQLLAFSRRQIMEPQTLDLNEQITNLAKMVRRLIGEDVTLELQLSSRPVAVRADPGMLDQVLMNLVINSRDAMPDGGRLRIETMARDSGTIAEACVRVSDTGLGIPASHLSRIFEPFFTTKAVGRGTGLGLATAFGIVTQHGGRIDVSSVVGAGATFEVTLPRVAMDVREEPPAAEVKRPAGGTEVILVVEDEPAVRLLTRVVLERGGYRVLEAATGDEALRVWDECAGNIDLVLTDIVMPDGMSGRELAQRLEARRGDLHVIFSSGYSPDFAGRELTLKPGQAFLQKPTPPRRMLEVVRQTLDWSPGAV